MRIVVLVKQVPDSSSERGLRGDDNTVERGSASNIVNEMDDYAVEEALKIRQEHGGEIVLLTMGPPQAAESLRKAFQVGPDEGVHVVDDALRGSDTLATSKVLAAAIRRLNPDLILAGAESTDARGQVMAHMLSERLGIAALTGARKLTVDATTATIERQTEEGYAVVTAALPAIVSVWDTINEPRYPTFKGIMAAKNKPLLTLSLAELGIAAEEVGHAGAYTSVLDHAKRPARQGGNRVADEGNGGVALVEYLVAEKFV